jgi:hypothetical protein
MENPRMIHLRTILNFATEEGQVDAIKRLIEIPGADVLHLLAGNLVKDGDAARIAAAKAFAKYRDPASVHSLAQAVAPNIDRPAVLRAIIEALRQLDLCASIPVLVAMMELNKWALSREALHGIEQIGCTEALPALVRLFQRAESEAKRPDFLQDPLSGAPTENRQKNKILAALEGPLRDQLQSLTRLSLSSGWDWALAVASRRTPFKRYSLYRCNLKHELFTVPNDKPQNCPYQSGEFLHEDVFLKHVGE